ncbi:AsnC family protein [Bordetella genomosp. 7]|jgi:DNA-binding Lrp family transcriptional regulator|uniref:siroheme decarboxylase n=1 Tax=Bordetella genomosp. 7 TaxID=1416805 RepID=A0A261QWN3_9BORD|nr:MULTISPECIES: AsnC family transcriptional regulator [Bordetella]OZI17208.1 AsnC family protein [Bordetella genomosp. 7]OZI17474.1 AsnC family protein [Bordetella genomosp. 7]
MDEFDRRLLNVLQRGLPLVPQPWEALARELGAPASVLRARVRQWLDNGTLTRFGPMFDIEPLGGAFTLAALCVPSSRIDEVAGVLAHMPEVAHNYLRDHVWNMWFVLACESQPDVARAIDRIEQRTGLAVLNLPKEKTYHVGLHFPV